MITTTEPNWEVESYRIFAKTKDESGKKITIPVRIVSLFVYNPRPIVGSGFYRITRVRRKGRTTFGLSERLLRRGSIFDNPSGKVEAWSTVEKDYTATGERFETEAELLWWLIPRLGKLEAERAVRGIVLS